MSFKQIKDTVKDRESNQICDRIMSRIDNEDIKPCPRWQFVCFHYGIWLLWALSVVMGAIAIAVMLFVATHARFALFEATHETSLSFFVEVLPYLWLLMLFAVVVFAYFNMRHTKHGYRYPVTHIFLSSLAFSVVGGIVLHTFGVGYLIDHSLSKGMPMYPSVEKKEEIMWQDPFEGRLLGNWQGTEDNMMFYHFIDKEGEVWSVSVSELRSKDLDLLETGALVKLLGTTTNPTRRLFHACGVFPWMMDKNTDVDEMVKNRSEFVDRMREHKLTGDRLRALEEEIYSNKPLEGQVFMPGLCADIAAVKRVMFIKPAVRE